jgi:hypothetical protein
MNLRKLAEGKECQVRIPGICNFDNTTTVLAHYSLTGISGRGLKSPDIIGAWACSACHSRIDGQIKSANYNRDQVRLMFCEGVFRTQYELIKLGIIGEG